MRHYPILIAIVAGVVLAGILQTRSDRPAAVAFAATRTLAAGTARVEIRVDDSAEQAMPARITGLLDFRNHRAEIQFGPGGEKMILDGRVTYHQVASLPGANGKWIGYDPGESDPFNLQERILLDPAQLLDFVRQTSGGVKDVGRDAVRGVETTHFEGTLDLRKLVEQAEELDRAKRQEALESISEGPTVFQYGIWVDDENVARRLRLRAEEDVDATIEFYDFGVPARVDVPSPGEVISRDELFAAMEKRAQANEAECDEQEAAIEEEEASGDDFGQSKVVLCLSSSVEVGPDEEPRK